MHVICLVILRYKIYHNYRYDRLIQYHDLLVLFVNFLWSGFYFLTKLLVQVYNKEFGKKPKERGVN